MALSSDKQGTDFRNACSWPFFNYSGDTSEPTLFTFTYEDGTPIDFTGATIELVILQSHTSTTSIKTLTVGSGITVSGTSNNILSIILPDLAPGNYVYRLQVCFSDQRKKTFVRGTIEITQ